MRVISRGTPLLCLLTAMLPAALAQVASGESELLQASQAVIKAVEQEPVAAYLAAQQAMARAEIAGLTWPNPVVSFDREQLFDSPAGDGETEMVAGISQQFDFSGRKRLQQQAAEHRINAQTAAGEALKGEIEAQTLQVFYQTLHQQRRVDVLKHWKQQLQSAMAGLERRAAAGDAAEYDVLLLNREIADITARIDVHRAEREFAWSALVAIMGQMDIKPRPWPRVGGTLLPHVAEIAGPNPGFPADEHPEITALDQLAKASEIEKQAAGRWWIPELTVNGGYKVRRLPGDRAHGFTIGASIPVPLFSRNQGAEKAGVARQRQAEAEKSIKLRQISGEIKGWLEKATILAQAAREFQDAANHASVRLVETAQAGFLGGELSVLALVDAYERAASAQLKALDMALAARTAQVRLGRLTRRPVQ
ncbi:MAG: TolC family protein [Myxococcota bacterium]|nr:TolC family protein [Myxococcota bacterium]